MNELTKNNGLSPEIISSLILKGDISGLNQTQKVEYITALCERIGLDPATQPFQILNLQGKQVPYATKGAAEQLTKKYEISHEIKERATVNDIFIVYARASLKDGRFEDSSGAVSIAGLKGDTLANATMKAETKAKRRATLSLLGLGMLDETEIETIPSTVPIEVKVTPEAKVEPTKEKPIEDIPEVFAETVEMKEKLKYDDEVITFGYNKGKTFGQIGEVALKKSLEWAKKNNKYPDFVQKAEAHLNDDGLPF